ncbi:MAG TPA: autotransporter-associated beta strand repeat-containing protein [Tepidisphaeraceae bacterium]|nr:autotransporter-associated beta strand repeat-containing protein [Tepidisphaeraceae bacterium]
MTRASARSRILALAAASLLTSIAPLRAAVSTWDGGGTAFANDEAAWNDPINWNPNGVPNLTTDVTFASGFASGHTIVVPAGNMLTNSLTINTATAFSVVGSGPSSDIIIDSGSVTRNDVAGVEGVHAINLAVLIQHDSVWNINGSNSLSVDRILQNGGNYSVTKSGAGTLVLGNNLTGSFYSGTAVNAGTLQLVSNSGGSGTITVAAGAVLSLDGVAIAPNQINLNSNGISGNGVLRCLADSTITGGVRFQSNSTIGVNAGARLTIEGTVSDGASTFALIKVGNGTLELANSNTYSGLSLVNEGTLTVSADGALGGGSSVIVATDAALNLKGGITINKTLFLNGTGTSATTGALRNFANNNVFSGLVALQSNVSIGADTGLLTIDGVISNNFAITKFGPGRVTLTAANTHGDTNISEGPLRIRNNLALGFGTTNVFTGGALELEKTTSNNSLIVSRPLRLNGTGVSNAGALRNISGNNIWFGNISLSTDSSIGVEADQLNINGPITATSVSFAGLTKVGPGSLILSSSTNDYADTTVSGGDLILPISNALPAGTTTTVNAGASINLQNSINVANPLRLNGLGTSDGGALKSLTGSNIWSGAITLQGNSSIGVNAGTLTVPSAISGAFTLNKDGPGTLILSGSNAYTGGTNVNTGVLSLQGSAALPSTGSAAVSPGAAVEVQNATINAAINLKGTGILGAGAMRSPTGTSSWNGPITLQSDVAIGVDAASQLTIGGVITDGASAFSLTKVGAGTLILTAANTYDGDTFVNGGILRISADNQLGAATSALATNNGGKLLVAGNTTTSRTFNLNNGSLQVDIGSTLTYTGATVNGGFLRGPGTHQINDNSSFNGVTALTGTNIIQPQPTRLVNFTNAGSITSSAPLTWDGGFNTPAGNITVNSTFNTQGFENTGVITINNGAVLTNSGNTLTSGGGSRITINPGGQLNAGPGFELNGALLVNNGTITGTTNVNFLALAKGSGTFGPVNVTDGGKFSPGNSPGTVTTGSVSWGPGGGYLFEINNAAGTQGVNWDLWNITGDLSITAGATTNSRFTVSIASLDPGNAPGNAANFNNTQNYSWLIASTTTGITGFATNKFTLDSSTFTNPIGAGSFALNQIGNNLFLNFNAGALPPPQWNVDTDGSWSTAANWTPTIVPNDPSVFANFLGKITAPRTVTLDGDKTVGAIAFDNPNSYTIAPGAGGTLTIAGGVDPSGNDITVANGSHTISVPLSISTSITAALSGAASLTLSGGLSIASGETLTQSKSGTLTISGPQTHQEKTTFAATGGLTNLNSNAGAPASAGSPATHNLSLNINQDGHVTLGANQDLRELEITTTDSGPQQLNLNSPAVGFRAVHVYASDLALAKTSLYNALRNALAPGALDPTDGIFDSGRGLHANSGIGLALVNDAHGDPNVFIRLTRIGDLNLDGQVTISDFIDLASHFNGPGTWQEGDLNYDGQITISDFIDLASNFNTSYSGEVFPINPDDQQTLSSFAAAHGVSVPEPSALLVFGSLAAGCILRGRKMGRRRMKQFINRRKRRCLALALPLFVFCAESRAADKFWGNTFGGTFSDPVNWQGGSVAGASDVAHFGLTTNPTLLQRIYFVDFSANATNQALKIEDDFVTFNLNSRVYALTLAGGTEIGNQSGRSGKLTILGGAMNFTALGADLPIGSIANASGTLTIGAGGSLTGSPLLSVGNLGSGTLIVENGGLLTTSSAAASIGNAAGATGTATIRGANSVWSAGPLTIGSFGAGTLNINTAGSLQTNANTVAGSQTNSSGTVNVDGANSQWISSATLTLGSAGSGTLNITAGGHVQNTSATMAVSAGGIGAASVSGSGSTWTNTDQLVVGDLGSATLNISAGGVVQNINASVGQGIGGSGNVVVSGPDSRWTGSGTLMVGNRGQGIVQIDTGAQVQNTAGTLGALSGSVGSLSVLGANSRWNNTDRLAVGDGGSGFVQIFAGGVVQNTDGFVGRVATSVGQVLISDANSQWINSGNLTVGEAGEGILRISAGAKVENFNGVVAANAGSIGTVTVEGPNSRWINGGTLNVGLIGFGTLNVTNGATVQDSSGRIGLGGIAKGVVNVGVAGASWINNGPITVGTQGTLNLNAGGSASAASGLSISSGGTVNLNGGQLSIGSAALTPGAIFNFTAGTLKFTDDAVLDDTTMDTLLGQAHTIGPLQHLAVDGTAALNTLLVVDGGTFSVGNLPAGSPLLFKSGTLNLTLDDLTIGSAGFFGDTLVLANRTINTGGSATIDPGARLILQGGSVSSVSNMTNQGEIVLADLLSQVSGGQLINSGTLRGSGVVKNNVQNNPSGQIQTTTGDRLIFGGPITNAGQISLIGGEMQFNALVSNSAATGTIAARNGILRFNGGLANSGNVALSFGTNDIFGNVTNNSGGRIIISGNSNATFYSPLVNNGQVQVSTGSTAVFFAPVSGGGSFVGAGAKFFESGSSSLAALVTPGSTTVSEPASVAVDRVEESLVVVRGLFKVRPNGTSAAASSVGALTIDGSSDAWQGLFDLANNSLIVRNGDLLTITNQIKDGLDGSGGLVGSAESGRRLGAIRNGSAGAPIYTTFDGIGGLAGGEILVRHTLIGDLNLDRQVTISDFIDLAAHFNSSGATWQEGDLNYDGQVTISDFIDLASNFNSTYSGEVFPISPQDQQTLSSFAAAQGASVPEPTSLSLLALAAATLPRRRRKLQ